MKEPSSTSVSHESLSQSYQDGSLAINLYIRISDWHAIILSYYICISHLKVPVVAPVTHVCGSYKIQSSLIEAKFFHFGGMYGSLKLVCSCQCRTTGQNVPLSQALNGTFDKCIRLPGLGFAHTVCGVLCTNMQDDIT